MFFSKKEKLNIGSLRSIFEAQKKTLLEKGYPELLNMSTEDFNTKLEELWKSLSNKINNEEIVVKGTIPLLIVVEHGDLSEKIKTINGHSELDLTKIKDTSDTINQPFSLLLDVEDGTKMIAKSPKDALKKLEKEKCHAVTINESIALLTHYPDILKHHYFISAGSFYTTKDNESLPLLWLLDEHGSPELHYAWFHIAHGSYGTGGYAIKFIL